MAVCELCLAQVLHRLRRFLYSRNIADSDDKYAERRPHF